MTGTERERNRNAYNRGDYNSSFALCAVELKSKFTNAAHFVRQEGDGKVFSCIITICTFIYNSCGTAPLFVTPAAKVQLLTKDIYRKVPKFSDAGKLICNLPKIQTKSPNPLGISSKRYKWNSK